MSSGGEGEKYLSVQEAFEQAWGQFEAAVAQMQAQGADEATLMQVWQGGQALAGLVETLAQQSRAAKAKAKALGAALAQEQEQRAALLTEMEELKELAEAVENQDWTYGPLEALYESAAEIAEDSFSEWEMFRRDELEQEIRIELIESGRYDEAMIEETRNEAIERMADSIMQMARIRLGVEMRYYQAKALAKNLLKGNASRIETLTPQDKLLKALLEALAEEGGDERA